MSQPKPFVITGCIGSGKSTIAEALNKKYNVAVIDADIIVRELQSPGQDCFKRIVELLGDQVVAQNGELDRKKIASIVFNDKDKLNRLNECIHPAVYKAIDEELNVITSGGKQSRGLQPGCIYLPNPAYIAVVIPLYFEVGHQMDMPSINIGVSDMCTHEKRIMERDGENAVKRLKSQMSLEEREKRADLCIRNDSKNEIDVYCNKIIDFLNK